MDIGDNGGGFDDGFDAGLNRRSAQKLPDDLPTSLDDRRKVRDEYSAETEIYDAWQGQSLTASSWDGT